MIFTALVAAYLLAVAAELIGRPSKAATVVGLIYLAAAIFIGGSTIWFGQESLIAVGVGVAGVVGIVLIRRQARMQADEQPAPAGE